MKRFFIKNAKNIIAFAICFISIIAVYSVISCPIRFLTGVSCPGCGMTRALKSILNLDFSGAFYYHPAIFIMPLSLAILLLRWKKKISVKAFNILIAIFVVIMLSIYIYRLLIGSQVVNVDFESGVIYKILEKFTK